MNDAKAEINNFINKPDINKTDITKLKPTIEFLKDKFKNERLLEKILYRIKNANREKTVDLTDLYFPKGCPPSSPEVNIIAQSTSIFLDREYTSTMSFPLLGCDNNKVILQLSEIKLTEDKKKITGIVLQGDNQKDIEDIWKWLGIIKNNLFRIEDIENSKRIAFETETLYIVRTPLKQREVNVFWDNSMSGIMNNSTQLGVPPKEVQRFYNWIQYSTNSTLDIPMKSMFEMDNKRTFLEIVEQESISKKEVGGINNQSLEDFNSLIEKIRKIMSEQKFVQLGTKNEPCDSDVQFCVEVGAEFGTEKSSEFGEEEEERFYNHSKKEGDFISMNVGFSRNFIPKSLEKDYEFVKFKPSFTAGISGEGKFWSYKEYKKILPIETDYTTNDKFNTSLSFEASVAITGKVEASAGLKGAIDIWGEASGSVNAKLLSLVYEPSSIKQFSISSGPVTCKGEGKYGYTLGFIKYNDTYSKEWKIIDEFEF